MRVILVLVTVATVLLGACDKKTENAPPTAPTTEATPTESAPVVATATPQATAPTSTAEPAAGAATQPAAAQGTAALELARNSGCLACHSIEKKVVGPAWKDVAARYKGNADAKQQLVAKVKKGGRGNWTDVTGGAPMPPYSPRVTDADIETLVDFVLAL